jgi:hypothetical protein
VTSICCSNISAVGTSGCSRGLGHYTSMATVCCSLHRQVIHIWQFVHASCTLRLPGMKHRCAPISTILQHTFPLQISFVCRRHRHPSVAPRQPFALHCAAECWPRAKSPPAAANSTPHSRRRPYLRYLLGSYGAALDTGK